jgi:predicted  nucleic acid-binding Zn-ribbon protein
LIILAILFFFPVSVTAQDLSRIEERLIRLEEGQKAILKMMETMEKSLNKRIDDTNRRIDNLTKIMMGLFGGFIAILVAILGYTFWVMRQYKPVAEPRMDWIEKHTTERISKLEEKVEAIEELRERVDRLERRVGG